MNILVRNAIVTIILCQHMSSIDIYYWYKSRGICPRCHAKDASKGKVYCLDCLDKEAVATMIYKSKHDTKENNRIFCRDRYQKAKEEGICVRCFKRKARDGKISCQMCFNKIREKQAIYQRLKRMDKKNET